MYVEQYVGIGKIMTSPTTNDSIFFLIFVCLAKSIPVKNKILIIINEYETVAISNCNNITMGIIIPKIAKIGNFYNLI